MHEIKMALNSQLSTKNRNHLIKMVLKTGFSTKMNLPVTKLVLNHKTPRCNLYRRLAHESNDDPNHS